MNKHILTILFCILIELAPAQTVKVLFSANKGEQASNADWVIDADNYNLFVTNTGTYTLTGNEANAQRYPTPAQSGITASTAESFWSGGISAMAVECVKLGYLVETLPYNSQITYGNASNPQDLSNYRIYVLCEPNLVFTAAEKTAIMNYINNGGRLLMVSDHETADRNGDGWEARTILNDLMFNNSVNSANPFGMKFDSVDIFQTSSNYTANSFDSILNSPQFGSVTQMKFANGTTMTLNPTANSTVKGHFYSTGASKTTTQAWVASCRFGKGKVLGFGDSSPFDDGTGDANDNLYDGWIADASGNHRKIIMNSMLWLAKLDSSYSVTISKSKDSACETDTMTLTANATGTLSYSWNTGATTKSIIVNSYGNYSVTVTNASGITATNSVIANIRNRLIPSISISGNTISVPNKYLSYLWYNGINFMPSETNFQFVAVQTGNYKCYVVDSMGCEGFSKFINYTEPPVIAKITKSKDSICSGDSILLSSNSAISYYWSNGKTTQSCFVKSSGVYSLTVTNASGVSSYASTSVLFYSSPNPLIALFGNNLSTTNTFFSYQWYLNNSLISNATTYQYSPTVSGLYNVIVSDAKGCKGKSTNFNYVKSSIQDLNYDPKIIISNNSLVLDLNSTEKIKIELIDLTGKIIYSQSHQSTAHIDLSIAPTLFFLKISDDKYGTSWYKLSK